MYVPTFNALTDRDEIRRLVRTVGSADLVAATEAEGFPLATRLPVIWDERRDRLVFHMARANPHWKAIAARTDQPVPALAVVTGPEAYVSPGWYASKAEHGRVVPTWNYSAVHFAGHVTVHDDREWLRAAVTELTDLHETPRGNKRWAVTDAPASYIDRSLRAIVGVELAITRIEAKAKLSQNRDEADIRGVVAGLRSEGGGREREVADAMEPAESDG